MAWRKRCAGLSLEMGRWSARPEARLGKRVLGKRTGAWQFRNRRVHSVRATGGGRTVDHGQCGRTRGDRAGGGSTGSNIAMAMPIPNMVPMRSANGSPEPFHVHYWEIGNEIWGDWVRGHSDAQTYAKNLNRYVENDEGS